MHIHHFGQRNDSMFLFLYCPALTVPGLITLTGVRSLPPKARSEPGRTLLTTLNRQ